MAEKRRLPGDFTFGILNDIRDSKTGKKLEAGTGGLSSARSAVKDLYAPSVLEGTGPYRAVVLRVDQKKDGGNKATTPDDASFPSYGIFSPSSTEKDNIPVVAIRARIPELDSHLPVPEKYGDEGDGPHQGTINMYTLFTAQDDLIEVPEPGSIVWVDFGGGPFNRTDPVYLGPVLRTQYAGQAGTIAGAAAGYGAGCAGSMSTQAGGSPGTTTGAPGVITAGQSPGPRGALVEPVRQGGSVVEGPGADPCIVGNLKKNLNSGGSPIDAWTGTLSGNGGRELIIYIPGTTDFSKRFEVIYWMHGANSYYTQNISVRVPKEITAMSRQGRNFIFVHPALPWGQVKGGAFPCRPCKGCRSGQMREGNCSVKGVGAMAFSDDGVCGDISKLHTEIMSIMSDVYKANNTNPFITIAVHSRGGLSISSPSDGPYGLARQMSKLPNGGPDRVTLADADYGFKSNQSIWDHFLSKASGKKVEFNILVSYSNVISRSPKYPNNSLQAKNLFQQLGHEAPEDFRSWFGKHQVPVDKSGGHTVVYIGGESGGPFHSHTDVGFASMHYEHAPSSPKQDSNVPVSSYFSNPYQRDPLPSREPAAAFVAAVAGEDLPRTGAQNPDLDPPSGPPEAEIVGPASFDQAAAAARGYDCRDLKKRLSSKEKELRVMRRKIIKLTNEKQKKQRIFERTYASFAEQSNQSPERGTGGNIGVLENMSKTHEQQQRELTDQINELIQDQPTVAKDLQELQEEETLYYFHPTCKKLRERKPKKINTPASYSGGAGFSGISAYASTTSNPNPCGGAVRTVTATSTAILGAGTGPPPANLQDVPDLSQYFHGPERCAGPFDPRDTRKGWACPAGSIAQAQGVVASTHKELDITNPNTHWNFRADGPLPPDWDIVNFTPVVLMSKGNGMCVQNKRAIRALDFVAGRAAQYNHPPLIITNEVLPNRNGAYRDPAWNIKNKGAKGSRHMRGDGYDIMCPAYKSVAERLGLPHWTKNMRINLLKNLWNAGFRNFGHGKSNIHADTALNPNRGPRRWNYNGHPIIRFKEFDGSS